jgi:hypothetical protein
MAEPNRAKDLNDNELFMQTAPNIEIELPNLANP